MRMVDDRPRSSWREPWKWPCSIHATMPHILLRSAPAPASAQHKRIFREQGVGGRISGELNPSRRRLYTGIGPEGVALIRFLASTGSAQVSIAHAHLSGTLPGEDASLAHGSCKPLAH